MRIPETETGEFVAGNPTINKPGSMLTALLMNSWLRELRGVVEGAGLTLDPADDGQVRKAIIALISKNVLASTEQIAGILKLATAAQAQDLMDDTTALTPKKLADAFKGGNQSLGPVVGFQRLPGGLILQWGGNSSVAGTWSKFVYPVAFPNAMLIRGAFSNDTGGMGIFSTVSNQQADNIKESVNISVWTASNARAGGGLTSWVFALGY